MTDADTLTLAYFRQEFQISPQAAHLLLILWTARRPLFNEEISDRLGVGNRHAHVLVWELRRGLERHDICATLIPGLAKFSRLAQYSLSDEARREIGRLLRSAITTLSATLQAA